MKFKVFRVLKLKLLSPILYQILGTLLNDGYAKYVYNNRYCSNCPCQLFDTVKTKISDQAALMNSLISVT